MEKTEVPHEFERLFVPTSCQRLLHDLNNSLAAVNLRLGLVAADATCVWRQEKNLEAMARTLEHARRLADHLEDVAERETQPMVAHARLG